MQVSCRKGLSDESANRAVFGVVCGSAEFVQLVMVPQERRRIGSASQQVFQSFNRFPFCEA